MTACSLNKDKTFMSKTEENNNTGGFFYKMLNRYNARETIIKMLMCSQITSV